MNTSPAAITQAAGPVLLFDGECGLCQRFVRLMLRLDRRGNLRYAPLQGPTAQAYLGAHGLPTKDFDTIVFVPDWARREQTEFLLRTDGLIAALRACGPAARILATALSILPARWRDGIYRAVGRWRYRIFGAWRPRPLARPEWAKRFMS